MIWSREKERERESDNEHEHVDLSYYSHEFWIAHCLNIVFEYDIPFLRYSLGLMCIAPHTVVSTFGQCRRFLHTPASLKYVIQESSDSSYIGITIMTIELHPNIRS